VKYLLTAVVFVVMFIAADAFCDGAKAGADDKKAESAGAGVCPACGLKHIDTADEGEVPPDPFYGVNEENENPEEWQSYDENTGLPDAVPSDSEWYDG
jgi:hypothetical protein